MTIYKCRKMKVMTLSTITKHGKHWNHFIQTQNKNLPKTSFMDSLQRFKQPIRNMEFNATNHIQTYHKHLFLESFSMALTTDSRRATKQIFNKITLVHWIASTDSWTAAWATLQCNQQLWGWWKGSFVPWHQFARDQRIRNKRRDFPRWGWK